MAPERKIYGRVAYDPSAAAISDLQLAHKEIVAALEWMERGNLKIATDRAHLAYRIVGEMLAREGIIEKEEDLDKP